jgi:quercetin dioxygenase-like cupin family protein
MTNNIQGKVWGDTQCLFFKNNVEIHRINTNKGGYCSKHKHDYKFNAFYIERGKMKITAWKNDYDLVDETIIEDQQMTVVPPREYHMFEALEDTVAYEIYWVDLPKKDIIRDNHGGK